MENSITQVLLNGSMPNFAEVLGTVRTLFTQILIRFWPLGQFLLGSLFSKWDLKVGISVSWQGFFIFMLRIRVGGLPCGLARPLIYIYIYICVYISCIYLCCLSVCLSVCLFVCPSLFCPSRFWKIPIKRKLIKQGCYFFLWRLPIIVGGCH